MGTFRQLVPVVLLVASVLAQSPPKFMGRTITITTAGYEDAEHMFPKGPATVCLEGAPRQCYTGPENCGRDPKVELVQLDKSTPALFFSASSVGGSGFEVRFALLRQGEGRGLEDLFGSQMSLSERGQYSWWSEPLISGAKIFVTPDYIWAVGECHGCEHRWIISAYVRKTAPGPLGFGEGMYDLDDRYMTVHMYSDDAKILNSERAEILARLRRVKQQSPH
jgi:hypothetical protein